MAYQGNDIWPDRPPTAKQYAYAWSMSHTLKKELPQTLDITAFSIFIERNKEDYNTKIKELKEEQERIIFEENYNQALKEFNL